MYASGDVKLPSVATRAGLAPAVVSEYVNVDWQASSNSPEYPYSVPACSTATVAPAASHVYGAGCRMLRYSDALASVVQPPLTL